MLRCVVFVYICIEVHIYVAQKSSYQLSDVYVTTQVASALVKLDAPKSLAMAVVPMGTANDFATSIGLPEDPWEALQLCTMDTAQPIDVGVVNDKV